MKIRLLSLVLLLPLLSNACGRPEDGPERIRFWAMGREGEVVQELVRDFERENPDVKVEVQQIPWSAAHEKLLTAHVGDSTPDVAQLGNTWVGEFVALRALEPLGPWIDRSETVNREAFFDGIWETNVIEGEPYGVPWYVDTRVLFYRKDILAAAGYEEMPGTWGEWRRAMEAVKRLGGEEKYALFLPTNEFTQPIIFGLQAGSTLLSESDTRGAFTAPPFREAFRFLIDLYRDRLAPPVGNTEISNLYTEFAKGYFAMYITGPWNLGEFERRLPADLRDDWGTAPLPGPTGIESGVSLAGGASLVLFRDSKRKEAAWRLVEYLSAPTRQVRFYELTGDLPARREAWDDPGLAGDERTAAFREQLTRVRATPKIPEWEQIATRVMIRAEEAIREATDPDSALALLDRDAARILEKRRWLMERRAEEGGGAS